MYGALKGYQLLRLGFRVKLRGLDFNGPLPPNVLELMTMPNILQLLYISSPNFGALTRSPLTQRVTTGKLSHGPSSLLLSKVWNPN